MKNYQREIPTKFILLSANPKNTREDNPALFLSLSVSPEIIKQQKGLLIKVNHLPRVVLGVEPVWWNTG